MSITNNNNHQYTKVELQNTENSLGLLNEGKLPSNEEIKKGISEVQEVLSENQEGISKQGKKILEDTNNLLETTKELVDSKNKGELVQKIYNQTYKAADNESFAERRKKLKDIILSLDDDKKDEAVESAHQMTKIMRLLVTSNEFRSLINDLELIFEKTFVVHENLNFDEKSKQNNQDKGDKEENQIDENDNSTSMDESDKEIFVDPVTTTNIIGINADVGKFGIPNSDSYYYGISTPKLQSELLNESNDTIEPKNNENEQLTNEEALEEVEETLINHWAKVVHTLNENTEYRESISYLFQSIYDLANYLYEQSENLEETHEKESEKEKNKKADENVKNAWMNAKKFLENWISSSYSLDRFINCVDDLTTKARNDKDLEEFISDLRDFFEKSVADKDYVKDEQRVKDDARQRIQRGRQLFVGKYEKEFIKLHKEFEYLNDAIQNDEGVHQLQHDFNQLTRDIFVDDNGNATIHTELLHDLQLIIPSLVKKLRHLPLPDIDISDAESDLSIHNAILDCGDIAPSYFRFTIRGNMEGDKVRNNITLVISKIRARVLNANFTYQKKTFPKISESGKADLAIYGKTGMTIALEITPFEGKNGLMVRKNICNISQLNLRLRETQHDMFYGLISPLINSYVKVRLELLVRDSIKKFIETGTIEAKNYIETNMQNAKAITEDALNEIKKSTQL